MITSILYLNVILYLKCFIIFHILCMCICHIIKTLCYVISCEGEQFPGYDVQQQEEDESDVILGHAVLQPPGEDDVPGECEQVPGCDIDLGLQQQEGKGDSVLYMTQCSQ